MLAVPIFGLLSLRGGKKTRLRVLGLMIILMTLLAGIGCGGGQQTQSTTPQIVAGTPAGTYAIVVTATNSAGSATAVVSLTVN
jgi:hypothetical protein